MDASSLILAVDPGEHIGLACYDASGNLHWDGIMNPVQFIDWCATTVNKFSVVVIESYRLRQGRAVRQTGSKLITSQVIGTAKLFARTQHAKVIEQDPQILNLGAMHMGIKVVSHFPDNVSAKIHGWYYLETLVIVKPKLQN